MEHQKRRIRPNIKFGNVQSLFGRQVASDCLNRESSFLGAMDLSEVASGGGSIPPPIPERNEFLKPPDLPSRTTSRSGTPNSIATVRTPLSETPLGKSPSKTSTKLSTPASSAALKDTPVGSGPGTQLITDNQLGTDEIDDFSRDIAHQELVLLEFQIRAFERTMEVCENWDSSLEFAANDCKNKISAFHSKLVAFSYLTLLNKLDGINKRFLSELKAAQAKSSLEEPKTPTVLQPMSGEGVPSPHIHAQAKDAEPTGISIENLNELFTQLVV